MVFFLSSSRPFDAKWHKWKKKRKKERQVAKADGPPLGLKPEGELIQRLWVAHFSSHHLLRAYHMPGRLDPALGKVMGLGTDRTANDVRPEQPALSRTTHTRGPEPSALL